MYLSMALITAAVALLLSQPLGIVFALGLVWIWNGVFIPHEERILENAFGSQYADYKVAVRRWI
jgi:protein-S-isoprenylcysteine O-methyltransferase Ste14